MNESNDIIWLTVDEANALCFQNELSRTTKTIRNWCRREEVDARKRTIGTGEQWTISKTSLLQKIKQEKQFEKSRSKVEHFPPLTEPVREQGEPFRKVPNPSEPFRKEMETAEISEIIELKKRIRSLEIDKGIRDRHIDFLERENEKGREAIMGQSRYIGHIETLAMQNGLSPEAKFLASPVSQDKSGVEVPIGDFENSQSENLRYNNTNGNIG